MRTSPNRQGRAGGRPRSRASFSVTYKSAHYRHCRRSTWNNHHDKPPANWVRTPFPRDRAGRCGNCVRCDAPSRQRRTAIAGQRGPVYVHLRCSRRRLAGGTKDLAVGRARLPRGAVVESVGLHARIGRFLHRASSSRDAHRIYRFLRRGNARDCDSGRVRRPAGTLARGRPPSANPELPEVTDTVADITCSVSRRRWPPGRWPTRFAPDVSKRPSASMPAPPKKAARPRHSWSATDCSMTVTWHFTGIRGNRNAAGGTTCLSRVAAKFRFHRNQRACRIGARTGAILSRRGRAHEPPLRNYCVNTRPTSPAFITS